VIRRQAPPLAELTLDEAATWFVEFNEGKVSQADRERFIQWIKTSPEHVRAYLQVAAHWEDARQTNRSAVPTIDELLSIGRAVPSNVIAFGDSAAKAAAFDEAADNRAAPPHRLTRAGATERWLVASLVALFLGGGTLYWIKSVRSVYATETGEQRTIALPDGSTVELDSRSKVRINYRPQERDIELLAGQALFRVAKDHSRPFVVQTDTTRVLAVGTQFDVYKHANGVTVTVVEGRVAVLPSPTSLSAASGPTRSMSQEVVSGDAPRIYSQSSPRANPVESTTKLLTADAGTPSRNEILVAAGEQVTISNNLLERQSHPDVAAATAWTEQKIVLNSTPLSEVVEEFNRHNTRKLVITDPRIAEIRISGVFSSTNPDSLLRGLEVMNQFRIRVLPDRVEISAR
jgi:transmembrane sensor